MVRSSGDEDLRARRKKVVVELVKGKRIVVQLKTLIESPDWKLGRGDDVVLAKDLSVQIVRSFNRILSVVNSCGERPAVDGGDRRKKKPAGIRDRRGCYKRGKNSESWVIESPTTQDGHAWRKYGQKAILNSQHPRCYYRCTHNSEGCNARKQVQIIKEDPIAYLITYLNNHTCSTTSNAITASYDNLITDNSTIINFQTKISQNSEASSSNDNHNLTYAEIKTPSSVAKLEEGATDDKSNEGANFPDNTKSMTLMDPWQGLNWSGDPMDMFQLGFDHHQSCESSDVLQYRYFDVDEVNQIEDIDMFSLFDNELPC